MRTFRTLAALLAVLTLSACGTPAANGSASSAPSGSVSSSAGASAQRDPLPADPAEDSLSVGDAYELYREVTVSNGRVLTLIAHGERQDEACFGISSIDVMDGDALVQTVSLHDGIVAGNAYDDFEDPLAADATRTFDLTSGLDTQDYNFDGFPDLAITEAAVGAGITSILFFLTLRRINLIDKDAEQSGEQRKEEPDDPAPTD